MKMGKIHNTTRLLICAAFFGASLFARSAGAPAFVTGAPGDGICTDCHGGVANTGGGNVKVALVDATNWTPGQQVRLRITLTDATAQRWGFEISPRMASDANKSAGTLEVADAANTRKINSAGIDFITHTSTGTYAGTSNSGTWDVLWTPPADANFGNVTFYVAGNAANNNGREDPGDHIYSSSLTVSPTTGNPPPTTTTFALPQLAFGGGWYTALYFNNTTGSAVSVKANFLGQDGNPITVPDAGGTSKTLDIGPNGTAIFEASNTGSLTQGWVKVDLPDGVIGYAIFRQSVQGRADQEAVVPLTSITQSTSTLIWDDTAFATAVAVANPTDSAATVNVEVLDDTGNSIGTSTINVPANGKAASILRDLQGLGGMVGHRGLAKFSVPSGGVSVLGLRFGGEAFTSIPTQAPAGTSFALPQLAFGGGWYTALYFSNTTGSAVSVTTNFVGQDGNPLSVPDAGGTSKTLNINANGTAIFEATNTGALTEGWVKVDLPQGVIGYAIFRQSVQGRADQEAVVPLTGTTLPTSTMIWDDTAFATAVAVANPTGNAASVDVLVLDANGNQIGSSNIPIPANGKTARVLRDLPGLSGMVSKRGVAKFSVPSAGLSVLGLRFGGEAFTSIPTVQK
ncbi:choice-of-anchor V domain-containing protein [uncultured Paludibaculum sp.]|uniref:choice-of-anchor V domain-containing protein n=1 Tax=uncultured Paludibaculum sp. TaxID=1765020 RepID=UPI002AAB4338|nr:choice-of-anchor V domain-containing protein [uncultured Paludibaculum sp.]